VEESKRLWFDGIGLRVSSRWLLTLNAAHYEIFGISLYLILNCSIIWNPSHVFLVDQIVPFIPRATAQT
jgi:hypothetical protein